MRPLVLLLLSILLFACKKKNDDLNADAVFAESHYQGETYTLQGDLKRDVLDIYLSFREGGKYDCIQKLPITDYELKMEGKKYYTAGSDSIYFYGIEVLSSALVQGYQYSRKGDSLIMIRTMDQNVSRQIRVKRVR